MTVKVRTKTKISQDQPLTLDAIHQTHVKNFQQMRKSIPNKKKEIQKLKDQIKKLDNEAVRLRDDYSARFELMDQKRGIELNIVQLENEIKTIENNEPEEEYILRVGHAMSQYYIHRDNHQTTESPTTPQKQKKKKPGKVKTIYDIFDQHKDKIPEQTDQDDDETEQDQTTSNVFTTASSSVSTTPSNKITPRENMSKMDIYNYVMCKLNNEFIPEDEIKISENDECPYCETDRELYQNEGKLVCPKCFFVDFILIDSDKPSYRDAPKEMTNFAYKRRNHFIEVLSQYQGRETTEIPEDVYIEILQELDKNRIKDPSDLTNAKLRTILKKIDQNRYYEHIPFIIYQLTGLKPPTIDSKTRKRLIDMFNDIQIPFAKYCPLDRRNFLSYSYILYKFFELLELDEHLPYLNLLKSRDKLHQQDIIWEKICIDLGWEYIPSV
jgi:hypothetical protein